jgi:hypothetical protein
MNNRMGCLLLCLVVLLPLSTRCALADDEQVWAALKQGKVILLRHTHVNIREGIGHLVPGNCAEEVNLFRQRCRASQAHRRSFRAHAIAVGEVLTVRIAAALTPASLRLAAQRQFNT